MNAGVHVLLVSKRMRQRRKGEQKREEMEQGEGRMTWEVKPREPIRSILLDRSLSACISNT